MVAKKALLLALEPDTNLTEVKDKLKGEYNLVIADDGKDAVSKAKSPPIDVVVIGGSIEGDVVSIEAIGMIKKYVPKMPIVVYSKYDPPVNCEESWMTQYYVTTQEGVDELANTIEQALSDAK